MALRALAKAKQQAADIAAGGRSTSVAHLYRAFVRELPRVMTIYDVDMPLKEAKKAVSFHFRKNAHVRDPRIVAMLTTRGYMELEETLLQWKQRSHLMHLLEPKELKPQRQLSAFEKILKEERS